MSIIIILQNIKIFSLLQLDISFTSCVKLINLLHVYVTVHANTFRKSAILISRYSLYCFFVFSLIRCGYHYRTLPPTLDSREMLASSTAALRTPPCLFPHAGARTDYTVKYAIKYTAVVKQRPASFAPISPFAVALLQFFIHRDIDRSSIDKHRAPPALMRR